MDYDYLPLEQKELVDAVDNFATAMKERLLDKFKQGYSGWKTQYDTEDVLHNVVMRLPRMVDPNDPVEIGIANWCLINHLIKNKQNA